MEIVGQWGPRCMLVPKPVPPDRNRDAANIGPIEANWRKLVPYFKREVKPRGFVIPMNALEDEETFIKRVMQLELDLLTEQQARDAIDRVTIEQEKELATVVDILRANGIAGLYMSSSEDDDDNPAELSEQDATKYGVPFTVGDKTMEEAAPYLRRIEWERYALACSNPQSVILTPEGGAVENAQYASMPATEVARMGKKLKAAIERDWAYGPTTPTMAPEQSFDVLGQEDFEKPDDEREGPRELGLHNFADDDVENPPTTRDGRRISNSPVLYEPNDDELASWEMDIKRIDAWLSL